MLPGGRGPLSSPGAGCQSPSVSSPGPNITPTGTGWAEGPSSALEASLKAELNSNAHCRHLREKTWEEQLLGPQRSRPTSTLATRTVAWCVQNVRAASGRQTCGRAALRLRPSAGNALSFSEVSLWLTARSPPTVGRAVCSTQSPPI